MFLWHYGELSFFGMGHTWTLQDDNALLLLIYKQFKHTLTFLFYMVVLADECCFCLFEEGFAYREFNLVGINVF